MGVIWRFQDRDNYWCCHLNSEQLCVELIKEGQTKAIFTDSDSCLRSNSVAYLQILDDGREIRIYLDGKLVGDCSDRRLAEATG